MNKTQSLVLEIKVCVSDGPFLSVINPLEENDYLRTQKENGER